MPTDTPAPSLSPGVSMVAALDPDQFTFAAIAFGIIVLLLAYVAVKMH